MARRTKVQVKTTLKDFLFYRIKQSEDFAKFERSFVIPSYITDNIAPKKKLRPYQERAVKTFIYLFEKGQMEDCKFLLFNMATGTGKTFVMACCMLYLYEKGYRNFIFLVHQVQILEQARKNFTDFKFDKYLFNPSGVSFNGRKVGVKEIKDLQDGNNNDINIMFLTTSLFYNRIKEDGENRLSKEDFEQNDVVVIADEAHRLNVDTRKAKGTKGVDKIEVDILNWESAVGGSIKARPGNLLLEFTATVDLADQAIHKKYQDRLLYKYDFIEFNKDGYCKDVQFLYNEENHVENQKKFLIVHAVALSQYRKMMFRHIAGLEINPVVLLKSKKIADSEQDREFFNKVIAEIRVKDLDRLQKVKNNNLISKMFGWLSSRNISLDDFVNGIKDDFAPQNTMIYNSQKKENPEMLAYLDHPRNRIRAIFSVNALNEGWDVLGLFDIIHFDIGPDKKVSLQDIQLIGRGARYMPFTLPEQDFSIGAANIFGNEYDNVIDKRKFDRAREDESRVMETFYYHFVKTGTFLGKLQEQLVGEGIISETMEKKTIKMKPEFLKSETYKTGFVLMNKTEKREKVSNAEIETTFNQILTVREYELVGGVLTDKARNLDDAKNKVGTIKLGEDFSYELLRKALVVAENGFFRFSNLQQHLPNISCIDEFTTNYLSKYTIKYWYSPNKEISALNSREKLTLLVDSILPKVRESIDIYLPKKVGSSVFRPVSIHQVFDKEKNLYFSSYPNLNNETGEMELIQTDERAKEQTNNAKIDLRLDINEQEWFAYSENYGTSEEKKFVKFMADKIKNLHTDFPNSEIFLVRNELDYWIFGTQDGKRFSPDYLLFINDFNHQKLYYQCVFEVKGSHLMDKDKWKEDSLKALEANTEISFAHHIEDSESYRKYLDGAKSHPYKEIRNIGFSFYNADDSQREFQFAQEIQEKLKPKK